MTGDLRNRLEAMIPGASAKPVKKKRTPREDFPEGVIQSNSRGSCLLIEREYPLTYIHGGCSLGELFAHDLEYAGTVFGFDGCHGPDDLIFLDTETTGLSSGTGTVAFLTGCGFFLNDRFVLRQYFMRDFDDEPAALEFLSELIKPCTGLVTFNGKSFDWNILTGRFVYNRMRPGTPSPAHIDLLYPSRRIWKLSLQSCRLISLEENILGEYRSGDIPGNLITPIYFKYLESGDFGDEMGRILEHNRKDILSMVSLLNRICAIVEDPLRSSGGSHELLGAGKIFESSGHSGKMMQCFESCMESGSLYVKQAALKKLTGVYKKKGEYDMIVGRWIEYSRHPCSPEYRIFFLTELAKYYEHKQRSYAEAAEKTEEALSLALSGFNGCREARADLNKRLLRLKNRLRKAKSEESAAKQL